MMALVLQDDVDATAAFARSLGLADDLGSDPGALRGASGLSSHAYAQRLSAFFGLRLASVEEILVADPLVTGFSQRFLREARLFPFQEGDSAWVAVADPPSEDVLRAVLLVTGRDARLAVVTDEEIGVLLERQFQDVVDSAADESVAPVDEDVESLRDLASGAPVVRLLNDLFERAHELGATDLHIEPMRERLQIRLRVDGVLRPAPAPALAMAAALISRVKIISGLDIAERRLAQDGAARLSLRNARIDVRVATIPGAHGECAVIRFLPRDKRLLDPARLGLLPEQEKIFAATVRAPNGLVIITGPTGSGKTTTLATALTLLNDASRKIVTVEDPIEYEIAGVVQTQVNPAAGLTFATALRSFLRHDPDVIMVGEIRDGETARIAVQAALTGHLVLTTLHTETAAAALPRLVDLGVEPFLLQSTLRAVLGQRLLRSLCDHCKRPTQLTADALDRDPRLAWLGLGAGAMVCEPVGCERCMNTGYRGRSGVFELLDANHDVRAAIRVTQDPDQIETVARRSGFQSMLDHAAVLCQAGRTSPDEALRVLGVR